MTDKQLLALVGAQILGESGWLSEQALLISDGTIVGIVPEAEIPAQACVERLAGGFLAPGLIDIQINGAGGVFFTQTPTPAALEQMTRTLVKRGTTAYLPTVISAPRAQHLAAQAAVTEYVGRGASAVLGIHLEGPFFSDAKRGCHPADQVRDFDAEDKAALLTPFTAGVRLITLAPERVAPAVIRDLVAAGNLIAIGHTNATYAQTHAALAAGACGFTHLYNAMSSPTGREPNVVGAALDDRASWCGIICDGHHLHPASVRLAVRAKPRGQVLLVSDAMAPLGAAQDGFELNGEMIYERAGRLVNAEGRLAGSAVSLMDCVRLAHQWAGIDLAEALRMGAEYPARALGVSAERGRLLLGARADLIHLNDKIELVAVWVDGEKLSD